MTTFAEALRARFGAAARRDEPLAHYTSFRIGGPADFLVVARSPTDIIDAVALAEEHGVPWIVLGRGSNVLVDDAGIRGLVIRNDATAFTIDPASGAVTAESGARMPSLGAQSARAGLHGLEWAVGIPGSVGGAVVMNAGAHGGCVADVLESAELLDGGRRIVLPAAAFAHAYRTSRLQRERHRVVLSARFRLAPGDPAEALARVREYRRHRQETQPNDPGAGSIFRNPPGHAAGALIDQAGLKGARRGNALISPRHANFIVNAGGASAEDVRALIQLAREEVARRFGIVLETEVELIGPTGRMTLA